MRWKTRIPSGSTLTLQEIGKFTISQAPAAGIEVLATSERLGHGPDIGLRT